MEPKVWTEDMGEISGFGGSYEAGCRAMVLAGIKGIDENPNADPQFTGFKGVFGLVMDDNADAKALDEAILNAEVTYPDMNGGKSFKVRKECTGAVHHAAINHVLAYKRMGWNEYCKVLRERKD